MAEPVGYAFEDGVARIVLADGARGNPVDMAQMEALLRAVRRAHDDRAKVILLSATGRYFCVGGDLKAFGRASSLAT